VLRVVEVDQLGADLHTTLPPLLRVGPVDRPGEPHDAIDVVAVVSAQDQLQLLVVALGLLVGLGRQIGRAHV
jgi:hypothetical protein